MLTDTLMGNGPDRSEGRTKDVDRGSYKTGNSYNPNDKAKAKPVISSN